MSAAWVEDRVEAYVDGSLRRDDRRRFEREIARDPALRSMVQRAEAVRLGLHRMQTPACPDSVVQGVLDRVHAEARARPRVMQPGFWAMALRPALVAAAAVILITVLVRPQASPPVATHANAEVEEALEEVKWTLAYLNKVGSRTGETLREEVFSGAVVRPIERGLGLEDLYDKRSSNDD